MPEARADTEAPIARSAVRAVRRCVERLDDAVPNVVVDGATRRKVVDAIGDYYEELATSASELVSRIVRRAAGRDGDQAGE